MPNQRFKKEIYGDPFVNQFIAEMEGLETKVLDYAYRDGDAVYSHITGGIILPTFDQPGYLITIGVRYDDVLRFDCLNEYETISTHDSDESYELIDRAQEIQKEYGKDIIKHWWGNPEEMMSLVNESNMAGNPIYIARPVDSNQTDDFNIYTARIKMALYKKNKMLYLGENNLLRNYIMSFIQDKKARPENNPALYVLGSLVHTLLIMRPWEKAVEKIDLVPTQFEDYAKYEHEKAIEYLYNNLEGGLI